uniref:CS domain-containing protein n=1 Tax=Chromera velia CCMP2878 TaxID=1169474 RepID=A0A0G4HCP5_9ALVE|eukprot:Cvel_6360.t1-p1 / transcript=Cvel_6360.t1 / gene=Cvel_6360 / organism=Chromera_velia_CCMP2878 / gene_product=Protein SGT1 homolog B, putative / transcript_product=Protein SGT1 homolog B, putative / location=Cvel_scaffold309:80976-85376(+) / protein_length=392 / sequence_SO=supercontig / SO=protein_coding / is_pseudo=false
MDPQEWFNAGNSCFVDENYAEAVQAYSQGIEADGTIAAFYSNRAAAYIKLGKLNEAIEDANKALTLDAGSRMALFRKGVALFYAGEYNASRLTFQEGVDLEDKQKSHLSSVWRTWLRKAEAEASGSALPLKGLVSSSTGAVVVPQKQSQPAPVAAPPKPVEQAPAPKIQEITSEPPAPAPSAPPTGTSISGRTRIRHEWVQNERNVCVTIYAKGVTKDKAKIEFGKSRLSVSLSLGESGSEEWALELDPLFGEIDMDRCAVKYLPLKVEIDLAKAETGKTWSSLEKAQTGAENAPAKYPTSSTKKKDWSAIDREIEKELKADKPQGEEALNSLFREIYSKGDEETRRAMVKSFQTSGGTVLSTNWGEVAKADYEDKDRPTAPDGQKWGKWEH